MPKQNRAETFEDVAVVTGAPANDRSKGYSFVMLGDGRTVYCSKAVTSAARVSQDDIGAPVRVRYVCVQGSEDRLVAVRVTQLGGVDSEQRLATLVNEAAEYMDGVDQRLAEIASILRARGHDVSAYAEEELAEMRVAE